MKTISLEQTTLDDVIHEAQQENVVITSKGKSIALMVSIEGMDEEQLQLGSSDKFWRLMTERRKQKTMNRASLEEMIDGNSASLT